jgi:GNAT superfamily N-acetyltransferase
VSDPLRSMRANMRAFYRLIGERAPGASVLECGGAVGAIVPSCPNQSVVNGVVYEDAESLEAARDEFESAYAGAGVRAWRVWVFEGDEGLAARLERAGHRRAVAPRAMTLGLAGTDLDAADDLDSERSRDDAALAALNEHAYGLPEGEFAAAMRGFSGGPVEIYLAFEDGEPAAGLATVDDGGDCGIYCVATRPESQGRGLASGLMRRALIDARDRGLTTSSLQSSDAGFRVYERIGYQDRGAIEVWERRNGSEA